MGQLKARKLGNPPVLAGGVVVDGVVTYERDIAYNNRDLFEAELAMWLGQYVSRASVAPLMADASGLSELKSFVAQSVTMSGRWRVKLHLMWDKLSNGQWYVEGVGFSVHAGPGAIQAFNANRLREKLLDAAEMRRARKGPPEWKAFFDLNQGSANWLDDALQGEKMIKQIIENAHEVVKEVMPKMKNPIGVDFSDIDPTKDGYEIAKAIAGTVVATAAWGGGAKSLGNEASNAARVLEKGWMGFDLTDKLKSNAEEKNLGKLAGDLLDIGLPLAFAEAGPIGSLGSVVLGSFFNIAIASDAARVAKARARLYYFFATGFVGALAPPSVEPPKTGQSRKKIAGLRYAVEQTIWKYGESLGRKAGARGSYLLQLGLLHYAATNNTTNAWSLQNVDQNWKHPQDYTHYWSRELMVRSFAWQCSRLKYLTN